MASDALGGIDTALLEWTLPVVAFRQCTEWQKRYAAYSAALITEAIVRVVDMPRGKRPFRTHVDPAQDGCEVVNVVADRIRAEFLRRIGLADLLKPKLQA